MREPQHPGAPARATLASAVPHAPPPSTPILERHGSTVHEAGCQTFLSHRLRAQARAAVQRAVSSSGQRARGGASSGSVRPSASRSAPAQAIIGAIVGAERGRRHDQPVPASTRRVQDASRIAWLAATPPATTSRSACRGARGTARGRCAAGRRRRRPPPPGTRRRGRRRPAAESGAIFSAARRSAVLRPEREKSGSGRSEHRARQGEARRVAACRLPLDLGPPG